MTMSAMHPKADINHIGSKSPLLANSGPFSSILKFTDHQTKFGAIIKAYFVDMFYLCLINKEIYMALIINGKRFLVSKFLKNISLLDFIRDTANLKSTKFGCGKGLCGAALGH